MTPATDQRAEEFRIFGPPGTGKTTYLSRQIAAAAGKHGSENILVTSFTRAAAAELVGRDLPIPRQNIGTLHSHCYRAMGSPEIAETHIDEWNKEHPELAISEQTKGALDEGAADQQYAAVADQTFAEINALRAKMIDPQYWGPSARLAFSKWCKWKKDSGYVDFTDMLEFALRDVRIAPGDPRVLFADEAQDFSKLQLSIIRQWGRHCDYMIVAGDEDQLLYGWAGCTVEAFLDPPVDEAHKRVLSQSFRVPREVHALAERWIKRVTVREPKEYRPRDEDGEVIRLADGNFCSPGPLIEDATRYLSQTTIGPDGEPRPKTVMFLAACSYMLAPLQKALREEGLPFHNPYRKTRGDWNPLAQRSGTNSTATRMLAFLKPREDVWGDGAGEWSADELRLWVECTRAEGLLSRGAKKMISAMSPDSPVTIDTIAQMFNPQAAEQMIRVLTEGSVGEAVAWLVDHAVAAKEKQMEYPAAVITKHGPRALFSRPQITLGTIHSVKGGQADVVYLFPDISRASAAEWQCGGDRRDAIIRQFYVGMTRARESLVICPPAVTGQWSITIQ